MPGASPPHGRLATIEGLRGVLALWVLFSHVVTAAGLGEGWRGPFRILYVGTHAVDCFIIVSGFVIFHLLDGAREGYGRFIARRALRLYPAYLICLLAAAALLPMQLRVYGDPAFPHPHTAYIAAIARASLANLPAHLSAHLTLLHAAVPPWLLPHANYAILHPGWSISLEWQFYLLAPALAWMLWRGGAAALLAVLGACAANALLAGPQGFLPRHVPEFALGIACFQLWKLRLLPPWPLLPPIVVAIVWLVTGSPAMTLWAAVFVALMQPAGFGAPVVNLALRAAPLQALGRWSYSIYLSHTIILVLAMDALRSAGAPWLGQWPHFALLLSLTLAGTVAASALLYRAVEAPCIAFGRRRLGGRGARPPPRGPR
jgi:peptidoglycan/LPS O-acetylase OafA/YrhL